MAKQIHLIGRILAYRAQLDGPYAGRIVFKFEATSQHTGVRTAESGWGMEKKIVR
jgi:hypothetical protein